MRPINKIVLQSVLALLPALILFHPTLAQTGFVSFQKEKNCFVLSESGKPAPLYASSEDFPGVIRALNDLKADIGRVTTVQAALYTNKKPAEKHVVIAGTLDKSPLIAELVKNKKIDVSNIAGKWETFVIQAVQNPLPGIEGALVIAGSDKRGTIFGIYEVSQQIGVSPWYWWADVPVKHQDNLYIRPGRYSDGEPAVKYRGIFINDEQPALGGWVRENYGGFNHQFYEKVFELILRLKGNFLWPAMWGQSFYSDDPLSPKLADEYGVVISTSHHEPMMRAHAEWQRNGGKEWNYATNEAALRKFWEEGIRRMGSYESIVTLAMRGDGDEAMSEDTNVALLERIVADQREIIANVTGKDVTETLQVWALYKEVQDYYDKGMRVPDDVTLLLCDDNWGNIRKLPKLNDPPRKGGYGIYYHYDYVGGPRNYKWLNTNPIARVWEQMHLAYRYGADRIWIVNVGDIKPMEFPIDFFLDYAWNPEQWDHNSLDKYTQLWAAEQFGEKHAKEIADILTAYTMFNGRRKPELLSPDTYSLLHYREAETIVDEYNQLAKKANQVYASLPPEYKDAYYQLVLFPVLACANLNELYVTVGKNRMYAKQGRVTTNDLAAKARKLFEKDAELTHYYNKVMSGGKWNHFMDQTHIGYTYWQQPEKNVMPTVETIEPSASAEMGVAIEGSDLWWPLEGNKATLPEFDCYHKQTRYIDIFNRGTTPFTYTIQSLSPWIKFSSPQGKIEKEQRIWLTINWNEVPNGKHTIPVTISGGDKEVVVHVTVRNPSSAKSEKTEGFIESNGTVSMEAAHYTRAVNITGIEWKIIPNLGRTLSGVTTFPVTASKELSSGSPHLEYTVHLSSSGEAKIIVYVSPTIDFHNNGGLRYAISVDDDPPQIVNIHEDNSHRAWERSVANNINISTSTHPIKNPGRHVVKFWMIDPGIVLQKIVVDLGGVKPSYLGPPESFNAKFKSSD